MDVGQKKIEVKSFIANGPLNVIYARIDICDEIQLADLMKAQFTQYFRQAANTSHSNSDTLHEVCQNLAKQRALLHGASTSGILKFNIASTAVYASTGALSFPLLEDNTQGNKTTLPFIVLHDLNKIGGTVTLSTTSNANTTITNDEGTNVKYFTDFSKYFLTRSRANGELISVDQNSTPYMSPHAAIPFIPPNTINGAVLRGTATDPTANADVRYEYSLVANSDPLAGGHLGGGYDLAEDYYTGNTFIVVAASNVVGTFEASEILTDSANNIATVKTTANTTTVFLETFDAKGTFISGETLTDRGSNATIFSIKTGESNTQINLTLTGSTFVTGSNTDPALGLIASNTITLDTNTVSRSGSTVTVIANAHGISSGERIVLKGADNAYDEFNDTFIVEDTTANTLTFTHANTGTVTPTGTFQIVNNIIFGRTSNAAAGVRVRTVNSSANIVYQSSDLSTGFSLANTFTGGSSGATGMVDTRTITGVWYKARDKEVKIFDAGTGTWTLDAAANTGEFWNKYSEPVRISTIIPTTGTGTSTVANKAVLTKAIATSGDPTGGYDSTVTTTLPGIYLAYPLKTWEDQVHDGVTTLEAYNNFANVIITPEGLEINFDWLPLGLGNDGSDLNPNGTVQTSAYNTENVTTLNKTDFQGKLGPYNTALASPQDDVFRSVNPDLRSNAIKVGTSGAVYPYANANPFFPAVGGSQKPISDTSNGITGTQPGLLDANSIYAGSYTEVQKGALDPPPQTDPQTIVMNNRYIIQNDLKWIYSSDPFDTNSSGSGQNYQTPQTGAYQTTYDGSHNDEINAVYSESAVQGPPAGSGATATTTIAPVGSGASATVGFELGSGATATATISIPSVGNGYVNAINITAGGTLYDSPPTVVFTPVGTTPTIAATAETTITSGVVTSITITYGGTGYSAVPTITFTPVTGKVTSSFTIIAGGSLYDSPPTVTITDTHATDPGTDADVTTTLISGAVSGFTVVNAGTGYHPATTTAVIAAATGPLSTPFLTLTAGGSGFYSVPTVIITDSSSPAGTGASAVATISAGAVSGFTSIVTGSGYHPSTTTVTFTGGGSPQSSVGSTVLQISPNQSAVSCNFSSGPAGASYLTYALGTTSGRSNMVMVLRNVCTATGGYCTGASDPDADPPLSSGQTGCLAGGGTWTSTYSFVSSTYEFGCLYNRIQYILTSSGAAITVDSTSGMQSNMAVLYQLLLDLTSAAYGKDYLDPVEPNTSGYSVGQGDVSFKEETEDMKSTIDLLIAAHNTERGRVAAGILSPSSYLTAFTNYEAEILTYKEAVKRRITEISNRIGYLNGKDTASGGSTASPAKSLGSAGDGFQGYTFSNGKGYANTVYSHANFLAGNKIKLLSKILTAISDVDSIYTQITSNRAEYYEYNQ